MPSYHYEQIKQKLPSKQFDYYMILMTMAGWYPCFLAIPTPIKKLKAHAKDKSTNYDRELISLKQQSRRAIRPSQKGYVYQITNIRRLTVITLISNLVT